jgi:hypothetical protein
LAQIVRVTVAVINGFTVRFKVTTLSQLVTKDGVVKVATALPPAVTVMPFQV